jgi:hypothetical protein
MYFGGPPKSNFYGGGGGGGGGGYGGYNDFANQFGMQKHGKADVNQSSWGYKVNVIPVYRFTMNLAKPKKVPANWLQVCSKKHWFFSVTLYVQMAANMAQELTHSDLIKFTTGGSSALGSGIFNKTSDSGSRNESDSEYSKRS